MNTLTQVMLTPPSLQYDIVYTDGVGSQPFDDFHIFPPCHLCSFSLFLWAVPLQITLSWDVCLYLHRALQNCPSFISNKPTAKFTIHPNLPRWPASSAITQPFLFSKKGTDDISHCVRSLVRSDLLLCVISGNVGAWLENAGISLKFPLCKL